MPDPSPREAADMTPREAVDLVEASIPWKLWAHSPELTAAARVTLNRARAASRSTVLADREAELLEVKGPCSDPECRLHYAHRGPHDTRTEASR